MYAAPDLTDIVLETPRLLLRVVRETDAEEMFVLFSDRSAAEKADFSLAETIEQTREILQWYAENGNVLALIERESGQAVGYLDFHPSFLEAEEDGGQIRREVGYALTAVCRGKGYMPEVLAEILRFCAEDGVEMVTACHHADNPVSGRVLEKCGFLLHSIDGLGNRRYICCL